MAGWWRRRKDRCSSLSPGEGQQDGLVLARQLLRTIDPPIEITDDDARDVDGVVDLLLDRRKELDRRELLYCLTCLLGDHFDQLADDLCRELHLLLIHYRVTEAAFAKLYTQSLMGRRERPFASWKHKVMRDVIDSVRLREDHAAYNDRENTTPAEKMMARLAVAMNRLEDRARRIAWLSWVEQRSMMDISRRTNTPLEHVELILDATVRQIMDAEDELGGAVDIDEDDFWQAMEGGSDE